MKYESYLGDARSVGELDRLIGELSRDGFRIVNVLDRSSLHDDRFLIVAQKDVDAQIQLPADLLRTSGSGPTADEAPCQVKQ